MNTARLLRAARTTFVAAAIGLAATACDSTPSAAPEPPVASTGAATTGTPGVTLAIPSSAIPSSTGPTAPAPASKAPPTTAPPKPAAPPKSTAAAQPPRFAGTQPYAEFVSYDRASGWLSFRVLSRSPNAESQDHFTANPADSAVHRLALAPSADIRGVDSLCGAPRRCAVSQVVASPARGPFVVQLDVDAENRVVGLYEQVGVIV